MAVNKVVYDGKTIVDMTDATATAKTILDGYGAYGSDGTLILGTSSGVGAVLTVTAPEGATVTITNGSISETKTATTEPVVFKGLISGIWTIDITDGIRSNSKTILITADYAVEITYYVATIHVKYPKGLVCTITNGTITTTAPDTSGIWDYRADYPGTWTVKLSNGFSEEVTVSEIGEAVTVDKWYVYKDGSQRTDLTGGWFTVKKQSPTVELQEDRFYVSTTTIEKQPAGLASTNNAINPLGFKTLYASANMLRSLNSTVSILQTGLLPTKPTSADLKTDGKNGNAVNSVKGAGEHVLSIDISSITGESIAMYPFMNIYCCKGEFYKMWFEA